MKKYLIAFIFVGSVFLGVHQAKAVTLDDLARAITSLTQQVVDLKAQLGASVYSATQVAAPSPYVFVQNLQPGSSGDPVLQLQQALLAQGYLVASGLTGYYGPMTTQAVMNFQNANGVKGTGIIDSQTNNALNIQSGLIGGTGVMGSSGSFQTGVVGQTGINNSTNGANGTGVLPTGSQIPSTGTVDIDAQINAANTMTNSYGTTSDGSTTGTGTQGSNGTPIKFTHVLVYGEKSAEVKNFQLWLVGKKYLPTDSATGFYGKGTVAAVKALQKANGVPTGDGTAVGPKTQAVIAKGVVLGSVK